MARGEVLLLVALASMLAFSLIPTTWAGTADAPEITDPAGDHNLAVVPLGATGQFLSADILKGWVTEEGEDVVLFIDTAGTGASGTAGPYTWTFHVTAEGTNFVATGTTTAGQPTPGGVATAAANDAGTITLSVPRTVFGAATVLTGLFVDSRGGTPAQGQGAAAIIDRAPNSGAGTDYTITGGAGTSNATGNATMLDEDGDGLNDTWEMEQFGNITLQNGTGDPDSDGLNNSAEFTAGTNATHPDTDGDNVEDGEDSAPLDPDTPALTNTTDRDNDTLPDLWERQFFNNTQAQNATGDPDNDTLNNSAELTRGTDPTKPDTDGDGADDADDAFPTDATRDSAATDDSGNVGRPELYSGAAMFAAAATLSLLGLARR